MPDFVEVKFAGLGLEEILDNLPVGIFIVEKSRGTVVYANKKAVELYGVDPLGLREPGPFKLLKLNGELYPTHDLSSTRALHNGETVSNQDLIIEQPNSKRIVVSDTAIPYKK
jgi:PAS domain-containing protein